MLYIPTSRTATEAAPFGHGSTAASANGNGIDASCRSFTPAALTAAPSVPSPVLGQRGARGRVELPRRRADRVLDDRRGVEGGLGLAEHLVEACELWGDHHHVRLVVGRAIRLEAQGLDHDAGDLRDLRIVGSERHIIHIARVESGLRVARRHLLELRFVHLGGGAEVPREKAHRHGRARHPHGLIRRHVLDGGHGQHAAAQAQRHGCELCKCSRAQPQNQTSSLEP
mmetsp:Transcript_6523/g.16226  ORF Transcript_6523/g.16226 Transcript_6523/m.16226 type:complete len:227 (-) Transcript_6523:3-683(-)